MHFNNYRNQLMLRCLCFVLILFTHYASFAQDSFTLKDSTYHLGAPVIKGKPKQNAQFVKVKEAGNELTYTPYDLQAYGFKKGSTYHAKEILVAGKPTRYFFEVLSSGKLLLYHLRTERNESEYYLAKGRDGELIAVPEAKNDLVPFLRSHVSDCPQATKNTRYLTGGRNNLIRFFEDYEACATGPLPRLRYGVMGGAVTNTFTSARKNDLLASFEHQSSTTFTVGAFVTTPLGTGNYALHSELNFKSAKSYASFQNYDLFIDYKSVNIPVLLRYSFFKFKSVPFIQAGPVYARQIINDTYLLNTGMSGDRFVTDFTDIRLSDNNQAGVAIGAGFIHNYGSRFSLSSEIRYQKLYNITHFNDGINIQGLSISLGLLL